MTGALGLASLSDQPTVDSIVLHFRKGEARHNLSIESMKNNLILGANSSCPVRLVGNLGLNCE